jgi:thiol-disulfide isomerase/thioredoxin
MHVARHFDSFAAEPWRVLAIWQGGFDPWGALLALVLVIAYRVRDRRRLVGIGSACVVGVLGWGGILLATQAGPGPDLPAQQLARLEGGVTSLAQLSGQPMIVNLWAGWCPPCVREMPLLNAAAAANPDVTFVFVNQGDERPVVARFLADQGLSLPNVLLDPNWQTLHHYDGLGLPTTLFLAADGSVLHSFAGEVSPELLAGQLQALRR